MQVVSFLKDREQTDALAALKGLDVGRLNEVIIVFAQFIKSAEGSSGSYFNMFPILQKRMDNLESPRASKHAETLVKAASKRSSEMRDLNIIVISCNIS
jgi:hypothetical protein